MAVVFSAAIRMSGWTYSSINVDGRGGGVVSGGGGGARWTRGCSTMRSPPKDAITQLAVRLLQQSKTATGPGKSAYTGRTAPLTKRSAVRSTNLLVTKRP
jgi:hypothetical protein